MGTLLILTGSHLCLHQYVTISLDTTTAGVMSAPMEQICRLKLLDICLCTTACDKNNEI